MASAPVTTTPTAVAAAPPAAAATTTAVTWQEKIEQRMAMMDAWIEQQPAAKLAVTKTTIGHALALTLSFIWGSAASYWWMSDACHATEVSWLTRVWDWTFGWVSVGYWLTCLASVLFLVVPLSLWSRLAFARLLRRQRLADDFERKREMTSLQVESVEWINALLDKSLKNFGEFAGTLIREKVNESLQKKKPQIPIDAVTTAANDTTNATSTDATTTTTNALSNSTGAVEKRANNSSFGAVTLSSVSLGDRAPRFSNFIVHPTASDEIMIDFDAEMYTNIRVVVSVTAGVSVPVSVEDLIFAAKLRVWVKLVPQQAPFAKYLRIQMREPPKEFDVEVRPLHGMDLLELPGLNQWIFSTVVDQTSEMMLAPKYIEVDLAPDFHFPDEKAAAADSRDVSLRSSNSGIIGAGVGAIKGVGNLGVGAAKGVVNVGVGAANLGVDAAKGVGNLGVGAAKGVANVGVGAANLGVDAAKGVGNLGVGAAKGVANVGVGAANLGVDAAKGVGNLGVGAAKGVVNLGSSVTGTLTGGLIGKKKKKSTGSELSDSVDATPTAESSDELADSTDSLSLSASRDPASLEASVDSPSRKSGILGGVSNVGSSMAGTLTGGLLGKKKKKATAESEESSAPATPAHEEEAAEAAIVEAAGIATPDSAHATSSASSDSAPSSAATTPREKSESTETPSTPVAATASSAVETPTPTEHHSFMGGLFGSGKKDKEKKEKKEKDDVKKEKKKKLGLF